MTFHGVLIERFANAYLTTHDDNDQIDFMKELNHYVAEKKTVPSIKDQKGPAFVYIAAGVWFSNPDRNAPWAERFQDFKYNFANLSERIGHDHPDPFTAPMDPYDGIGNQLIYVPPAGPRYLGYDEARVNDTSRRAAEVLEIQAYLRETDNAWNMPIAWSVPELVHGEANDNGWSDPLGTGFHTIDAITETRANIMLNLRCNAKLDRMLPYPYDRTCCTDYGVKPLVQRGLVYFGLVYLAACIVVEIWDLVTRRDEPLLSLVNMQAGSFILAVLMCYYADRTQMMAKGTKFWAMQDFLILCAPCVVIALITIRRSRAPTRRGGHQALPSGPDEAPPAEPDQPFLSRDQTDEWKGWMQFLILIYHWVGSRSATVYVLVRLLVAAYLFQTGYGHTLFFLNKKDFSFKRVAAVLLRLNLLSCSLAYFMDTDWMYYYFSPLVSFWFLVVYATMAIGHKRYNDDIQIVLAKICISAVLVSGVILATPVNKWLFWLLRIVFNIQWSLSEWNYRVSLDIIVVYVGMLAGVAYYEMEKTVNLALRLALAFAGFCSAAWYFHITSQIGSGAYVTWHPYVSFIPIFAWIALRNVCAPVRNFHSKAMAWLGRCSLETYTLQFHLLLAADTHGVLVVDGLFGDGTLLGDRWRSLIIIVPIFLWVCSTAATATGYLVKVILRTSDEEAETEKSDEEMTRFAWAAAKIPGAAKSFFTGIQFRIVCILLAMWLLNMLSPTHAVGPAPDGYTPHRAGNGTTPAGSGPTPETTPGT